MGYFSMAGFGEALPFVSEELVPDMTDTGVAPWECFRRPRPWSFCTY